MSWDGCSLSIILLWTVVFVALCSMLWALGFLCIFLFQSVRSIRLSLRNWRRKYMFLSDNDCEIPFAESHLDSDSPPPRITLMLPSYSSEIQQLQIVLQARRDKESAAKQAREAAIEREVLGSTKSLKVPVLTLPGYC